MYVCVKKYKMVYKNNNDIKKIVWYFRYEYKDNSRSIRMIFQNFAFFSNFFFFLLAIEENNYVPFSENVKIQRSKILQSQYYNKPTIKSTRQRIK